MVNIMAGRHRELLENKYPDAGKRKWNKFKDKWKTETKDKHHPKTKYLINFSVTHISATTRVYPNATQWLLDF